MSGLLKSPRSIVRATPKDLDELAGIELIADDGESMDSDWHCKAMILLINSINHHFRDREDFYAAGNMFIYFNAQQARNHDFRGPDFFFVWNTNRRPMRDYWAIWQEKWRTPNVVIELCSPTTTAEDHGCKKDVYESTLKVPDYFCYDPASETLEGWRLKRGKYVELKPNVDGRLWSEELGLWVGPWRGDVMRYADTWLRFFDKDGGLILDEAEAAEAEAASLRAKVAVLEAKAKNGSAKNGKGKKKKK